MHAPDRLHRWLVLWIALIALAAACGESRSFEDRLHDQGAPSDAGGEPETDASEAGSGGAAGMDSSADLTCIPAVASDVLRARSNVMERGQGSGSAGVFTMDLFGLFQSNCGACHVDNSLGGLQTSLLNFPMKVTSEALERVTSDDPALYMPPAGAGGKPFSERSEDDPVVELAGLLEAWLAAGRPGDVFYPASSAGTGGASPYLLSQTVGTQMTNLGNCIPPAQMIGDEADKGAELDEMFEDATALPERLEQTDLFTLDAEQLARHRVIAFAPAYTLWADNAKKIRMVRVPMGKTIAFDAESQTFDIPPNTRFYKTFLKRVVDIRGNESYRKMETRLILSRPDEMLPDGSYRHTALFGTYAWNEEETEAVLVRDPLRNGEPFRDRLVTYVTDEQAAEAVITTGPDNLQEALREAGLSRTYAIPGSERCIQCHMGAPTKSFVLGFSPLQVLRRPLGESGVIEPAERDELNQLQRLIDYGVISGMNSPDEVVLLEDSQGERKPRTEHELSAQGYMVGNCAHCHNPRGYPSVIAPELRDVLNFMPSSDGGGIFEFSLETFSPRIFRGVFQNVPQPYITPSLHDRKNGTELPGMIPVGGADNTNYLEKAVKHYLDPSDSTDDASLPLLAPWRSLIYRNVDTPFTYEEDFSIYPHMPMNTPGYDCRARQLLGSWMVSIPARVKTEGLPEMLAAASDLEIELHSPWPQPYVEVLPDDPDYTRQRRAGEARVSRFEQSMRYTDCPDPSLDIVDPEIVRGETLSPYPLTVTLTDEQGNTIGGYSTRVPERPHYAVTDLTNPPGDWFPRRPDWSTVLVDLELDGLIPAVKERVAMLQNVVITEEMRRFALEDVPFGLWRQKESCDFSSQETAGEFAGDNRPRWMDAAFAAGDAPVYVTSPGAQVFTLVCSNCHGPQADSAGRLAATIADMTGGQTRVANLRDGIFGPVDMPGANRTRVFGEVEGNGVTAEDWAARYLVFMGLGGTLRTIPKPALQTIRNSTVLGVQRRNPGALNVVDANMLSVPKALCEAAIPTSSSNFVPAQGDLDYSDEAVWKSALIATNGDAEMWRRLCSFENEPPPVRVVMAELKQALLEYEIAAPLFGSLLRPSAYPADARVGDQRGQVQTGISADNTAPWCMVRPSVPEVLAAVQAEWEEHAGVGSEPPYCPDAVLYDEQNWFVDEDAERWATRGAMNAGLAVFLYLDALANGKPRPIAYDRCEELAP